MKKPLTVERLRHLLRYDHTTGQFTRLVSAGREAAGNLAGARHSNGYLTICLDGVRYYAHRLAWLYVYGTMPLLELDHINGIKTDNRIANLREVTKLLQQQNQRAPHRNKKSGLPLGVTTCTSNKSVFAAKISVAGTLKYLGVFASAAEAHAAYLSAKRLYHEGCTI